MNPKALRYCSNRIVSSLNSLTRGFQRLDSFISLKPLFLLFLLSLKIGLSAQTFGYLKLDKQKLDHFISDWESGKYMRDSLLVNLYCTLIDTDSNSSAINAWKKGSFYSTCQEAQATGYSSPTCDSLNRLFERRNLTALIYLSGMIEPLLTKRKSHVEYNAFDSLFYLRAMLYYECSPFQQFWYMYPFQISDSIEKEFVHNRNLREAPKYTSLFKKIFGLRDIVFEIRFDSYFYYNHYYEDDKFYYLIFREPV